MPAHSCDECTFHNWVILALAYAHYRELVFHEHSLPEEFPFLAFQKRERLEEQSPATEFVHKNVPVAPHDVSYAAVTYFDGVTRNQVMQAKIRIRNNPDF